MRTRFVLLSLFSCLLMACAGEARLNPGMTLSDQQQQSADAWAVRSALQANVAQGAIAQHAVYPFDFVGQSAELTESGKHNVGLLADYLKGHSGSVTLVRGEASPELYQQRTASVRKALEDAGAAEARVTLVEGQPGGEGRTSQDLLQDIESARQAKSSPSAASGGGTSAGGTSGVSQ